MSLIGQWLFDDAGQPGLDGSSTQNTATFIGDANVSGGRAVFDGAGDYVHIPHNTAYDTSEVTVAFSFTADAVGSEQGLVSRDSSNFDGGGHVNITIQSDGSINVRHQSSSSSYEVETAPGFVTAGQTFDVSYSFGPDGGMRLFVDGALVDTNTQPIIDGADLSLSSNDEPWTLGAAQAQSGDISASGANRFFDGSIDFFEIYSEELTPAEIPDARAGVITDMTDAADDGTVTGTDRDDVIYGGDDSADGDGGTVTTDTIDAGAGNDTIIAGDGSDSIEGGFGDDSIQGGAGDDVISDTGAAVAAPTVIVSEDFEGGASGWTDNTTESDTNFSEFLGRFAGTGGAQTIHKTFTLEAGRPAAVVEFDFYRLDSWDGEEFRIFVDDNQVFSQAFTESGDAQYFTNTFVDGGTTYSVTLTSSDEGSELGFNSGFDDQRYKVRIEVDNPDATLKLGFGSTLNQAVSDESFGIDNVVVLSADSTDARQTDIGSTGADTIESGAGNDIVYSGGGGDLVYAGSDIDSVFSGSGADTAFAGAGDDTIDAGQDNDTVFGGDGNDSVIGEAGADVIYGGSGNDDVSSGAQDDTLYGGTGADTLNARTGNDSVFGGDGDDSIATDDGIDLVYAGTGNDQIYAGQKNDVLFGGSGNDSLQAGDDQDTLYGGTGADYLEGNLHDDLLYGGDGADELKGGDNNDLLYGGEGNDSLSGNSQNDTVYGDAGSDQVHGGIGQDTLYGGAEGDSLFGGEHGDTLFGGDGADHLDGDNSDDTLYGGAGDDILAGASGNDTVFAGSGNDTLTTNIGHDLIYGGVGSDSLTANAQNDTVYGGDGTDTINAGNNEDTVYGGVDADSILAGSGDDTVYGGTGDDDIVGQAGNDLILGEDGNDTIEAGGNADTVFGGSGADSINGQDGTDILYGGDGNDIVSLGALDDTIYGGDGDDTFTGGNTFGDDTIFGGEGGADSDTLDFSSRAAGVEVSLTGNESGTVSGGANTATFQEIEEFVLTGSDDGFDGTSATTGLDLDGQAGNDSLNVGSGDDTLTGGAGNDTLDGRGGNDTLFGGDGDDRLLAGFGSDTFDGGSGIDTYDISNSAVSGFSFNIDLSAGNDQYGNVYDGIENVIGSTQADSIGGTNGSNILYGGTGDDILDGQSGADTLYGGAGNDTLDSSNAAGAGDDLLYGGSGDDRIDVSNSGNTAFGGDGSDTFISLGSFAGKTVAGGEGGTDQDLLSWSGETDAADAVNVTFSGNEAGSALIRGQTVTFSEIEAIEGTQVDDTIDASASTVTQTLSGLGGNDTINGGSGADSIDGGAGNDQLSGGSGDDTLTGGSGNDTFVVSNNGADDTITDFTTNDQLDSTALTDAGNVLTNQDGTVTADEVTVTGGGGSDQVLTFPNGETLTVPDGTVNQTNQQTQFASLVAMGVPPCFAPGTLILTERGEVTVERLHIGDMLITEDHGPQPLRWIGRRVEIFQSRDDKHKPIEFKAGSLGDDLPKRDLVVSPQHRMVLAGEHVVELFDTPEALALAKALTSRDGIRCMKGMAQVTYFSLLLARHEIIFAEGAPTESFRPGPVALEGFQPEIREQIYAIYPRLRAEPIDGLGPPARPILTRKQAEAAVAAQPKAPPTSLAKARERLVNLRNWDDDLEAEKKAWARALAG